MFSRQVSSMVSSLSMGHRMLCLCIAPGRRTPSLQPRGHMPQKARSTAHASVKLSICDSSRRLFKWEKYPRSCTCAASLILAHGALQGACSMVIGMRHSRVARLQVRACRSRTICVTRSHAVSAHTQMGVVIGSASIGMSRTAVPRDVIRILARA